MIQTCNDEYWRAGSVMEQPMSDTDVKPRCGATITGPIVKDRGRSRPLWRRRCLRVVVVPGERCWQHKPLERSR